MFVRLVAWPAAGRGETVREGGPGQGSGRRGPSSPGSRSKESFKGTTDKVRQDSGDSRVLIRQCKTKTANIYVTETGQRSHPDLIACISSDLGVGRTRSGGISTGDRRVGGGRGLRTRGGVQSGGGKKNVENMQFTRT